MIELFTYRLGRTLKVPLLDPLNAGYRARVEAVGELIRPVVENWESFREMVAHVPETVRDETESLYLEPDLDRPQHVAYMVRKMGEMLSAEEIESLGRQPFLVGAITLSSEAFADPLTAGMKAWSKAEEAMKRVYDGFSAVQGRLDLGMPPFADELAVPQEDGISLREERFRIIPETSLAFC